MMDAGVGFEPQSVDSARFGISLSIRERLASVGGSAEVVGRRGIGTEVRLQWPSLR